MKNPPEFILICGPMFANKTTTLLSCVEKFKYQKKSVLAFKPTKDSRYSESDIVSHNGWKIPAIAVNSGPDIIRALAEQEHVCDVIAIDELFMIHGSAHALVWAFKQGISVVASSIELSSNCVPFVEVKNVMPWATNVIKLTAACTVCGADARYTYMKPELAGTADVFIGGTDEYEARCFSHHPHFKIEQK